MSKHVIYTRHITSLNPIAELHKDWDCLMRNIRFYELINGNTPVVAIERDTKTEETHYNFYPSLSNVLENREDYTEDVYVDDNDNVVVITKEKGKNFVAVLLRDLTFKGKMKLAESCYTSNKEDISKILYRTTSYSTPCRYFHKLYGWEYK